MDYMMLEPYTNEFKGFVSDNKVMDELGLTKSQFDAFVMHQRLYKECVLIEEKADDEIDMVNHPPHYQHGIEPIEFIESHNLNFNLGSAVKYIARAPYKGKELEDLKKAKWFIEREIKRHDK